jgi:hypothetical protein
MHDNDSARSRREPAWSRVGSKAGGFASRSACLSTLVLRHAWRSGVRRRPADREPGADDLRAAIDWLCLTHDVTGRRGCSKGYSLVSGWQPAFPETTGYIIGTLLAYGRTTGRADLFDRAREMGDWELEIQGSDGGIMQGLVTEPVRRSIVFNTGMVLHGWLDLHDHSSEPRYLEAARKAGEFLVTNQSEDGAWRGAVSYFGIPHTYHSRVAWALLRLAASADDERFSGTAMRNLEWVLAQQIDNGWFENCNFKPGALPNSHGIAYTLRGLIEAFAITGDERLLEGVRRASRPLIGAFERIGTLPAVLSPSWEPASRYVTVTGLVQLGGVWLRTFQVTGDDRFLQAGLRAVEQAAAYQERGPWSAIAGAIPGSAPVWGRYAPLQFPNWATKFLADAFMTREAVVATDPSRARRIAGD